VNVFLPFSGSKIKPKKKPTIIRQQAKQTAQRNRSDTGQKETTTEPIVVLPL
jgi:hypothetical protein